MSKFFKEIAIAFVILFLINLIISYLIINPQVYTPYEMVMENIGSKNFIFSDSHGWSLTKNNYEGEVLLKENNIKNLSYGSDSYFDIYFKLNYIINQGIAIDTIYLSADPHMLGKKRIINNNRNRSIAYTDFETYADFFDISFPEFIIRKYVRKHLSTFEVNNAQLIQKYFNSILSNKNISQNQNWSDLSEEHRERESNDRFFDFYHSGPSKKQQKVLKRILNISSENNIVVIGVEYPLARQLKSIKIPETIVLPKTIFLNRNLKILNLMDIDEDIYFRNQDHVNNLGADIIINRILKIKL
jgi:hypothetical protein